MQHGILTPLWPTECPVRLVYNWKLQIRSKCTTLRPIFEQLVITFQFWDSMFTTSKYGTQIGFSTENLGPVSIGRRRVVGEKQFFPSSRRTDVPFGRDESSLAIPANRLYEYIGRQYYRFLSSQDDLRGV